MGELDTSKTALLDSALCPAGQPIAKQPSCHDIKLKDAASVVTYTLSRMGISSVPPRKYAGDPLAAITDGRLPVWQEAAFTSMLEGATTFQEYMTILAQAAVAEPIEDREAHDRHFAQVKSEIEARSKLSHQDFHAR